MTAKDKIKTLISVDRVLSQAIGRCGNALVADKEMLQNLINTREKLEAVIFALCDELSDLAAPEEHEHDLIGLWRRTGRLEPSSSEEQKSKEVHEAAEAFKRLRRAGIVDEHGNLSEWYRDDPADQRTNA